MTKEFDRHKKKAFLPLPVFFGGGIYTSFVVLYRLSVGNQYIFCHRWMPTFDPIEKHPIFCV